MEREREGPPPPCQSRGRGRQHGGGRECVQDPLFLLFLLPMAADEVSFQEPCAHIHRRRLCLRRRRRISQKSCWLGKYEWPRQAALARERAEGEWQGEAEICLLGKTSPHHHFNSYFCTGAQGPHHPLLSLFYFASLVCCVGEKRVMVAMASEA